MQPWSEKLIGYLTPHERERLVQLTEETRYRWTLHARPEQLPPPGDWRTWLVLAGRGWGKTRGGAEWIRSAMESGRFGRAALVAPTVEDARDVIVEGESGLLAICPPWDYPKWEPTKRRLTWPNGAMATTYSADRPDRLNGPQHDIAWADELGVWRRLESWDMLMFGLRLGPDPRVCVTTTPKPWAKRILKQLMEDENTVVTGGTTYENIANLASAFVERIIKRYEGTRLGRQELDAELLEDAEGALWKRTEIDSGRVGQAPDLIRVVVAIDPSATSKVTSDEAGIVVAGLGANGHGYVLDDRTLRASPHGWGSAAVQAYYRWRADRIIAETNNGGEMVELTIRTVDANVPYKGIHASRGKRTRAEPVAALYEQGRVHHVGAFPELEDEQCGWEPGDPSPNRMDALVWAFTELMLERPEAQEVIMVHHDPVEISAF